MTRRSKQPARQPACQPARKPPTDITGLDAAWSRLVEAPDAQGTARTWHLLDSLAGLTSDSSQPPAIPELTILCVHGNPSWSYLWRHVVRQFASNVRVIAVDQLDMGYSERTGQKRNLAMRVEDLCQLTNTLNLQGPVVTLAHDWGGPISLGWALRHPPPSLPSGNSSSGPYLAGIMLTNTAVHQPESAPAPALIRLIRSKALLRSVTVLTKVFINGAIQMSRPALSDDVRKALAAPYANASRRSAIADFVADIPLCRTHESAAALEDIAAGVKTLENTKALLIWGPKDRVFSDLYLHDLEQRLPHADVHRFPKAAHFVTEDANVSEVVEAWIGQLLPRQGDMTQAMPQPGMHTAPSAHTNHSSAIHAGRALADFSLADQDAEAVVETAAVERSISFRALGEQTQLLAAGMAAFGIEPGDRIAVMIMPGVDLSLVVYACWRLGATLVLVDSGLGRAGMQGALKSANPDYLIGIDKALIAARLLGWPGRRIAVGSLSAAKRRTLGVVGDLDTLCRLGENRPIPSWPMPDTIAAIAFTSGSTGPSKGVIYRHQQIQAQRDALMQLYSIDSRDRLVAAFAPFALYGPTMGITSMVPVMDVTKPATLSEQSLANAVKRINATLVFASPAALVNVVATHEGTSEPTSAGSKACSAVRLVLSAGAPVRASLLASARTVFQNASFHTPYGMTEVLPVADISLDELQALEIESKTGSGSSALSTSAGVCVGYPVRDVSIEIDPLNTLGITTGELTVQAGVLGEIVVRAPHIRQGYDRLWFTEWQASQPLGAHRTGDIGQLDSEGRLWVGGRLGHVIVTDKGPIAPVAGEQLLESLDEVAFAALVGVGPSGTQAVVAVLQIHKNKYPAGGAPLELIDKVRNCLGENLDIASVLVVKKLPVDRRHNSKIDRTAIASWASCVLAGDKVAPL